MHQLMWIPMGRLQACNSNHDVKKGLTDYERDSFSHEHFVAILSDSLG